MKTYARIDDYEDLYARYLDKPAAEMVDLAGDVKGKVVWDLCCGGGALSAECLKRGAATVQAVDGCSEMTNKLRLAFDGSKDVLAGRFRLEVADVEPWLRYSLADRPNFVFCRQAVNYWLNGKTVRSLAGRMGNGSVFVFNTFNTRPAEKPSVKEYGRGGDSFVEVSWLVPPDTVHHVQVRNGMAPHVTAFRWIPPSEYLALLGQWYNVDIGESGGTSLYRCVRT